MNQLKSNLLVSCNLDFRVALRILHSCLFLFSPSMLISLRKISSSFHIRDFSFVKRRDNLSLRPCATVRMYTGTAVHMLVLPPNYIRSLRRSRVPHLKAGKHFTLGRTTHVQAQSRSFCQGCCTSRWPIFGLTWESDAHLLHHLSST